MAEKTEATENASANIDTNLNIADMVTMLSIVQAAAARGAIKPEEMVITGTLHDKLKKFLESTGAIQPATAKPVEPQPQKADQS